MSLTIEAANAIVEELPTLPGFKRPEVGYIKGNTDDTTKYRSLAEVACAALMDPECTGFTYVPGKKWWRLRKGDTIRITGYCVESGDYSYIKKNVRATELQHDDL